MGAGLATASYPQNQASATTTTSSPESKPGSQQNQASAITTTSGPESKPKKKICCACPETKKLRDECIVENGEEACSKWIEAHRKCLRAEGFDV
ncbi:Cytochrome c oxidase copper chaperone [Corchorus capsularis]|uniref:Cytochrome c oxidase copper chaperone n=1 Tax=Corchorus capsularis TaxID=210143 RepID=A0A1R3GC09_COCAP|nr:Cytochrome c oxidase copper chaperone [Corchorus capsularis]